MDLHTAAKRYEEVRRFWAREIALKLSHGSYRNQIYLLRHIATQAAPVPTNHLLASLPVQYASEHSRDTSGFLRLRSLMKAGLVTRKRHDRVYWYRITELGELVLEYIQDNQPAVRRKNSADNQPENSADNQPENRRKKRGRPRKTLVTAHEDW